MSKHTPEPWQYDEPDNWHGIAGRLSDLEFNPIAHVQRSGWPGHVGRANGRRVAACVNALSGIADPAAFVKAARELADAATRYETSSFGTLAINTDRLLEAADAFRATDAPH